MEVNEVDRAATTPKAITALALAALVGAIAPFSPPAALLIISALAARALLCGAPRWDGLSAFTGPVVAALLVAVFVGAAAGVGVLFTWRLFADARWSVQEAARLAYAVGRPAQSSWKALLHAWLTPLFGLTLAAYTAPHMIAGLPLDLPHVPLWAPLAAGIAAALATLDWVIRRAVDWRLGELAPAPTLHLAAHHILFLAAYGVSFDLSAGIFAVAAWRLAHAAPIAARQASFTAVP